MFEFQTYLNIDFRTEFLKIINDSYRWANKIDRKINLLHVEYNFCELHPISSEEITKGKIANIISRAFLTHILALYKGNIDCITKFRKNIELISRKLTNLSTNILKEFNDLLSELKIVLFEEDPLIFIKVFDNFIIYEDNIDNPDITMEVFGFENDVKPLTIKYNLLGDKIIEIQKEIKDILLYKGSRVSLLTKAELKDIIKKIKEDQDLQDLFTKTLEEVKNENQTFLDAFKKVLKTRNYIYLEPMNKSGGWAELHYVYSSEQKIVRAAKLYTKMSIPETMFNSDAKKLMEIEHENVVKVIDKGNFDLNDEKIFFLILELVRGQNFEEIDPRIFLERPYNERLKYFIQVLDGINEFRKNFKLHRDLDPSNIMISEEDINKVRTIKIIDPGSSRYYYEPGHEDIDLYLIKEGIVNLFLKPDELKKINEKVKLKEL